MLVDKLIHGTTKTQAKQAPDDVLRDRLKEDNADIAITDDVRLCFARRVAMRLAQEKPMVDAESGEVLMSYADLATAKMGVEIVVAWWLIPLLDVVMLCEDKKKGQEGGEKQEERVQVICENQDESLWQVLSVMVRLLKIPFVTNIVREGHVVHLIAGYLQLGYGPGTAKDGELGKKARALLWTLLETYFPIDTVLESLLSFVSPSYPEWLSGAAGSLLSRTMLRPTAVLALLTMMLEDKPANRSGENEGIYAKTAVLVTTVPKSHRKDPTKFHKNVLEQLLQCLLSKSEAVRLCVAICIERLLRQDAAVVVSDFLMKLVDIHFDNEVCIDQLVSNLTLLMIPCGAGSDNVEFWDFMAKHVGRMLLLLGCAMCDTASRLSTATGNLLESMIRVPSKDVQRRLIMHHMILDPQLESDISFQLGSSGGAVAVATAPDLQGRNWERECAVFSKWALKSAPEGLLGDLFSEVMNFIASSSPSPNDDRCFIMLELASELLLQPKLLQDASQILLLAKSLLSISNVEDQVAILMLTILDEMIPKLRLEKYQEPLLSDLIPVLQNLGNSHPDLFDKCVVIIEAISASLLMKAGQGEEGNLGDAASPDSDPDAFESAIQDLEDPLLPVRAHGLLTLRKLVLAKDPTTLSDFGRVLSLFSRQLLSSESSVYLGAIHGLCALGDVSPNETIPILVRDFHSSKIMVQVRLKVGEALVNIAQRCGQMLPVHAPILMDCFLRGIQDKLADVRASSFANIAAMCEILEWALHPYIREIIYATERILETEKDFVVRRAAVMVLGLLVRGLGAEKLPQMAGGQMEGMQTRLQIVAELDVDSLTRGHARTVLEELQEMLQ